MSKPSARLVQAIRRTAQRVARPDVAYRWSNFALCNCGHLAQTLTGLSEEELRDAGRSRAGDWAEQARRQQRIWGRPVEDPCREGFLPPEEGSWEPPASDTCPVSGRSMDEVFAILVAAGLGLEEVAELERLENRDVRRRLGTTTVDIDHTDRATLVEYLSAWADLLEEELRQPSALDGELALAAE